jgi:enoyl-CoA hydratase/carnithine racemase
LTAARKASTLPRSSSRPANRVRPHLQHLASFAPLVPRYMKAMVHSGMEGSLAAGLAMEKFAQAGLCETADKREGLAAFLEKRPPTWQGR